MVLVMFMGTFTLTVLLFTDGGGGFIDGVGFVPGLVVGWVVVVD